MRSINTKLLAVTVMVLLAAGVGTYFVHGYQVRRSAQDYKTQAYAARDEGREHEKEAQKALDVDDDKKALKDQQKAIRSFNEAAINLERYLGLVRDDHDARAEYAVLLDDFAETPQHILIVLDQFERVLQHEPNREDIRRRAVVRAMQVGRPNDALDHLKYLIEELGIKNDAELYDWEGQCKEATGSHSDATKSFNKALDLAGDRIDCYVRKALVQRSMAPDPENQADDPVKNADGTIDAMVDKNKDGKPETAVRAFLARVDYRKKFPPNDLVRNSEKWLKEIGSDLTDATTKNGKIEDPKKKNAGVLLQLAWLEEKYAQIAKNSDDQHMHLEEQRKYLSEGVMVHPKDLRFYEQLSALDLGAGRPEDAAKWLQQYLEKQPNGPGAALARYQLGEVRAVTGDSEDAERQEKLLREQDGAPVLADYLDAKIDCAKEKWLEGARKLNGLHIKLMQWPELARRADLLLAVCYEHTGEPDMRLAACQRAVEMSHLAADGRAALAAALAANGRAKDAILEYERLAQLSHGFDLPLARLKLARLLRLSKAERKSEAMKLRWEEIEKHLTLAESIPQPDLIQVALLRAEALGARDQYREARAVLAKVAADHADDVNLQVALAILTGKSDDPDQPDALGLAVARLRELHQSKEFGNRIEVRLALARQLAKLRAQNINDRVDEELAELEGGLEAYSDAEKDRLLGDLAEIRLRLGQDEQAERIWAKLADLQPENLRAHAALVERAMVNGQAASLAGNKDLVTKYRKNADYRIDQIKKIEGREGANWRVYQAAVLLTFDKDDAQQCKDAAKLLEEARRLRPNWYLVSRLQADWALLQNKPDNEVDYLQKAVDKGDRNSRMIGRLARLLLERGKVMEAAALWQKLAEDEVPMAGDLGILAALSALAEKNAQRAKELALKAVPPDNKNHLDQIWLAQILAASNDLEGAKEALERACNLKPDAPEAWVALVAFAHDYLTKEPERTQKYKEAMEKLRALRAPLALAHCYVVMGDLTTADATYEEARKEKPEDVATLRAVATHYIQTQRPHKAERHLGKLEKISTTESDKAWARRLQAFCLAARGDADKALKLMELNKKNEHYEPEDLRVRALVLSTQPEGLSNAIVEFKKLDEVKRLDSEEQLMLASLYEAVKNWPDARERLRALVAENMGKPSYARYVAAFVKALIRHEEFDDADGQVISLEFAQPNSVTSFGLRGQLLKAQKDHQKESRDKLEKGFTKLKKKIERAARAMDAPVAELAGVMEQLGDMASAEDMFRNLANLAKQKLRPPEDMLQLAMFYGRTDRPADGLGVCSEAVTSECRPEAIALVAVALLRSPNVNDQRSRWKDWLTEILIRKPDSIGLLSAQAQLMDLLAEYDKSEESWRKVLLLNPEHVVALNNRACLLALQPGKNRLDRLTEAMRLTDNSIEVAGPAPELLDTRGIVLIAQGVFVDKGKFVEAIANMKNAIARAPSAAKYCHLALAYEMAGDQVDADNAWKKAAELKLKRDDLHRLELIQYPQVKTHFGG
jgi:Tfp pilus assembly protein PilF